MHEHKQTSPPPTSAWLCLRLKWTSPSWPFSGVWFHLVRWWAAFGPPVLRFRLDRGASDSIRGSGRQVAHYRFLGLSGIPREAAAVIRDRVVGGHRNELMSIKQMAWISKRLNIDQSLSSPVWITAIKLWFPTQALCLWTGTCCDGCSVGVVGDKVRLSPRMTVLAGGAASASSRCFPA